MSVELIVFIRSKSFWNKSGNERPRQKKTASGLVGPAERLHTANPKKRVQDLLSLTPQEKEKRLIQCVYDTR